MLGVFSLCPNPFQSQGIAHNGNGAHGHCGGGILRMQQDSEERIKDARGNRNADDIINPDFDSKRGFQ